MRGLRSFPILGLAVALGAQAPGKPVEDLRAFYARHCVKCHGPDGSARGADGKKLGGFDFTDRAKAGRATDADMVKTIRKGIFFGFVMPAFKDRLTEAEAGLLVAEVLRKAEKGKAIAPEGQAGR